MPMTKCFSYTRYESHTVQSPRVVIQKIRSQFKFRSWIKNWPNEILNFKCDISCEKVLINRKPNGNIDMNYWIT